MKYAAAYLAASFFCATSDAAPFTIDTTAGWNGTDGISALAEGGVGPTSYGQTFQTPTAGRLYSWSFFMRGPVAPTQFFADFAIAEWTGDRAQDPDLFRAAALSIQPTSLGEYHELVIPIPDLLLSPHTKYIAYLNTSNYSGPSDAQAAMGAHRSGYADGDFWYQNSNNLASNVFNFPWTCADEGNGCRYPDTVFVARFHEVPTPGPLWFLLGIIPIAVARQRLPRA